jgi:HPt (histidine-containing phosphotransfer) domain-containing protein
MSTPRPNLPPLIVEWSRLLQLRELQPAGQPDVVLELIGDFLTDSERRIKLLHESAAAGKWRDVGHQAHTLKGSAALLACDHLCAAAEIVETSVRAGTTDGLADAIAVLADALEVARDALSTGPPGDTSGPSGDKEQA